MVSQLNFVPPLLVSDLCLTAFLQPGTEIHCYGRGISAFDVGMRRFISGDVISNTLLGYGLCICRERRRGGSVRCGSEETPNSILQEAGSKRRAARTADTVVMRIERSNEATERRALAKGSKRLYPRALLESLDVRIKQNEWESALRVRLRYLPTSFARNKLYIAAVETCFLAYQKLFLDD